MSVQLVNGHVLFPDPPNWRERVAWKRSWQTAIASAGRGNENRRGLRRIPRTSLSWLATVQSAEQLAILEARINAALKSGKACAGYWGRAAVLANAVSASTAALQPSAWDWGAGQYILFFDFDTAAFDAVLIDDFSSNTLTLHDAVSRTYAAGALCWPMIFGKLQCDQAALRSSNKSEVHLSLTNVIAPPVSISNAITCADVNITFSDLTDGAQCSTYDQTVAATGGTAPYQSIAITSGALPTGVGPTVNLTAGTIRLLGCPSVGTYTFTITAVDANGCSNDREYTVEIVPTVESANTPGGIGYCKYHAAISGLSNADYSAPNEGGELITVEHSPDGFDIDIAPNAIDSYGEVKVGDVTITTTNTVTHEVSTTSYEVWVRLGVGPTFDTARVEFYKPVEGGGFDVITAAEGTAASGSNTDGNEVSSSYEGSNSCS